MKIVDRDPGHGDISFDFSTILNEVRNYDDIQAAITKAISDAKARGMTKVGFVSGPLPKPMIESMARMKDFADGKGLEHRYPIISAAHIFGTVWDDLKETKLSEEERKPKMRALFDGILRSGVTDIFMMDGWRQADGAAAEYSTAENIGITIHPAES